MKILISLIFGLIILSGSIPSFAQASPGFSNAVKISNIASDSQSPDLIASSDGIFVLWVENNSGRSNVFFSKSLDGGNTFGTPINLSESNVGQSGFATFAQKGNNVYVTWQTSLSGTASVFLAQSTDGGNSFGKPVMISNMSRLAAFPQIAISDNHVYSTWLEKSDNNSTNVVFTQSDDQGRSFSTPQYITQNAGNSGIPKILANGKQVLLAWEDNSKGNFEIFLSTSEDFGKSFNAPVDVSASDGQSGTPQIAVSKNDIYLVWMDNALGNYNIFFAKSVDNGKSFSKYVNVSNFHTDSGYPQFAVSENDIYVTWTQTVTDQNYDIFFAKSSDNGKTFEKPINISNNFGASGWPKIASDGNIYISWVDSSPGKFDLFITKSSNGGTSFENATNISNTHNESYDSKMSALNNSVYVIWQEGVLGNHTISFAKSTTFVPEFGSFASIALGISIMAIIGISFRSNLKLKTSY